MKKSTRRKERKQAHARQWTEIVALAADGVLSKSKIAQRCGCCRQTVYNVLARARGLPEGQAPVPRAPGPPPGTGLRVSPGQVQLVVEWRLDQAAGRGGYHLCRHALLRRGEQPPAAATIGRIWLRAGLLEREPRRERPRTRWIPARPQAPGHVQVDVKYLPGGRYEFTALDVYSRYAFARVEERLDSETAADFLASLRRELPFAVHTVQVDGGSEFKAEFATALERDKLHCRRNAARSPWQNGVVERFHRTVAEECYLLVTEELVELSTAQLNRALRTFLHDYNHCRLHKSLGYRPPVELLDTSGEPVYPRPPKRCPSIP